MFYCCHYVLIVSFEFKKKKKLIRKRCLGADQVGIQIITYWAYTLFKDFFFFLFFFAFGFWLLVRYKRKEAEVNMEGHFLVRQIYEDDVTYNIVGAAERVLSKSSSSLIHYQLYICRSWRIIEIPFYLMNSTECLLFVFFFFLFSRYLIMWNRNSNVQKCQPIFCWRNSARNSSIFVKIPVTIEFYKCSVPHPVISSRYIHLWR